MESVESQAEREKILEVADAGLSPFVWIAGRRFPKDKVPAVYLRAKSENQEIKEKHGWSTKGVTFDVAKARIFSSILEYRKTENRFYTGDRYLAYSVALYLQLENAARVGEALEGLFLWLKDNKREFDVRLEKHYGDKEKPTIELRPFYVVREIQQSDRKPLLKFVNEDLYSGCRSFCFKKLGFSTHTLRHAGITEQMKRLILAGKNPFLVMKLTGHTSEKMLIGYLQTDELQALMREKLPNFNELPKVV